MHMRAPASLARSPTDDKSPREIARAAQGATTITDEETCRAAATALGLGVFIGSFPFDCAHPPRTPLRRFPCLVSPVFLLEENEIGR